MKRSIQSCFQICSIMTNEETKSRSTNSKEIGFQMRSISHHNLDMTKSCSQLDGFSKSCPFLNCDSPNGEGIDSGSRNESGESRCNDLIVVDRRHTAYNFSAQTNGLESLTAFVLRRNLRLRKNQDRMAITFVVIVSMFVFCHLPRVLVDIHELIYFNTARECEENNKPGQSKLVLITVYISHILLVIHSATKPIIYCCTSRDFRGALKNLFTFKIHY